jgi:hypothetical protein
MPYDGKLVLRELSKPQVLPFSANSNVKLQQDTNSPREQRRLSISQQLSRQFARYWLVWLLLCGVFAIRHTTKLLDAAGQHHYVHAPATDATPTAASAHGAQQQLPQQHGDMLAGSKDAGAPAPPSTSSTGSSSAGAASVLATQHSKWPDGYVAICAVIKDQWPDLRYWIEYHR